MVNSFSLPWGGGELRWRLATARRFGPSSASVSGVSGAPPAKMKAPKGAAIFGDPSCTVGSARSVAQHRGSELRQWLGFKALTSKIWAGGGSFYRGFDPMS
jgi:hypothetical protein